MVKWRSSGSSPVKFYVALQGDKTPDQYIKLGKRIEKLGFDRIYVYDDLMYRPSWPILNLIAANTKHIQLGPCLVNGFYRHPAILAENALFLDELSRGRSLLGVGRGAFFDYLQIPNSETVTRKACEETIQLVKRFFNKSAEPFHGEYFQATEKAILRWDPIRSDIPIVMGSWNEKMAYLAGKHCNELQVAESWEPSFLEPIYNEMCRGALEHKRKRVPDFSIGGITSVGKNGAEALQKAKETLAVYLPYLKGVMSGSVPDVEPDILDQIDRHSKLGEIDKAMSLIPDSIVDFLSLSGTPEHVREKLEYLLVRSNIHGILFSPPYGPLNSIEDNLQFIMDKVISRLNPLK